MNQNLADELVTMMTEDQRFRMKALQLVISFVLPLLFQFE